MQSGRTIRLPVCADGTLTVRVPLYAGVAGENHITTLIFEGAAGAFYHGDALVRILFGGADGAVVSTDLLEAETTGNGWQVSYSLPHIMTVLGGQITARLVLSTVENGVETQTTMTEAAVLFFDDNTEMEYGTPFWTCVSQMLKNTADAAQSARDASESVRLSGVMRYKGEATTGQFIALSKTAVKGDVYRYTTDQAYYLWDGETWVPLSKGGAGEAGADGKDGVSCTHSWNGTTLTVTSASGSSSADLKGAQGPKGDTGEAGADGVGIVSVDLSHNVRDEYGAIVSSVYAVRLSNNEEYEFDVTHGRNGGKGDKGDTGAQGPKGDTGAQGPKGDAYILTDADKADIVSAVIEHFGGQPIVGVVDDQNNIVLNGTLPLGAYTLRYEGENGEYADIVTMTITEDDKVSYTNVLPRAVDASGAVYNGVGYKDDHRISASSFDSEATGVDSTGLIPIKAGDVLRFKNCNLPVDTEASYVSGFYLYNSAKTYLNSATRTQLSSRFASVVTEGNDIVAITMSSTAAWAQDDSQWAFVRFSSAGLSEDSIVTINQEIV